MSSKTKYTFGRGIKSIFKERLKPFIDLDGKDGASGFGQLGCQSAGPGADFNDGVIGLEFGGGGEFSPTPSGRA